MENIQNIVCFTKEQTEEFRKLNAARKKELERFRNAIKNFLDATEHKKHTKFILQWRNKFSDVMRYRHNDEYEDIRTIRELRKVEDTIREFINECKNKDEHFEVPKHEDKIVRAYLFVESMKELNFLNECRGKFYDSMNLPI